MKTKHQTDKTSAAQQAAAICEQQQLAPGQHDMDLDPRGPEQHERSMELEREMAPEQSLEQLPGTF